MNNVKNFYDDLDLKYPEIAIVIEDIDRINPGYVKCIIPVLTPEMNIDKEQESTLHQTNTNLQNSDTIPEVTNLKVKNYMKIKIPKELCAFTGGEFEILKNYQWPEVEKSSGKISYENLTNGNIKINGSQSGSGSVVEGGSFNVTGRITGTSNIQKANVDGLLHLMPIDRYIKAPSKWIVVFIGGDITKPRVIGRYYEE